MSKKLIHVFAAFLIIIFTSSCSQRLRILFYNNTGHSLTLTYHTSKDRLIRDLEVGEKAIFTYETPAHIEVITVDCKFFYEQPPRDGSYADFVPSPRERPFRIDLQLQSDFNFYILQTGTELPAPSDALEDQPELYFPIKPTAQSCDAVG